ncbi:hypothetical protein AYI68_g4550 [Smittium mucronatum]|uniref:Uncharacterized protein n=1 Tax=Smittium mucronatum TaxID=133383 RepID=A0A1R0GWS4_9FUNG|nr:hypothetical protein AYI68_g4550 [Smittium mucronatum]
MSKFIKVENSYDSSSSTPSTHVDSDINLSVGDLKKDIDDLKVKIEEEILMSYSPTIFPDSYDNLSNVKVGSNYNEYKADIPLKNCNKDLQSDLNSAFIKDFKDVKPKLDDYSDLNFQNSDILISSNNSVDIPIAIDNQAVVPKIKKNSNKTGLMTRKSGLKHNQALPPRNSQRISTASEVPLGKFSDSHSIPIFSSLKSKIEKINNAPKEKDGPLLNRPLDIKKTSNKLSESFKSSYQLSGEHNFDTLIKDELNFHVHPSQETDLTSVDDFLNLEKKCVFEWKAHNKDTLNPFSKRNSYIIRFLFGNLQDQIKITIFSYLDFLEELPTLLGIYKQQRLLKESSSQTTEIDTTLNSCWKWIKVKCALLFLTESELNELFNVMLGYENNSQLTAKDKLSFSKVTGSKGKLVLNLAREMLASLHLSNSSIYYSIFIVFLQSQHIDEAENMISSFINMDFNISRKRFYLIREWANSTANGQSKAFKFSLFYTISKNKIQKDEHKNLLCQAVLYYLQYKPSEIPALDLYDWLKASILSASFADLPIIFKLIKHYVLMGFKPFPEDYIKNILQNNIFILENENSEFLLSPHYTLGVTLNISNAGVGSELKIFDRNLIYSDEITDSVPAKLIMIQLENGCKSSHGVSKPALIDVSPEYISMLMTQYRHAMEPGESLSEKILTEGFMDSTNTIQENSLMNAKIEDYFSKIGSHLTIDPDFILGMINDYSKFPLTTLFKYSGNFIKTVLPIILDLILESSSILPEYSFKPREFHFRSNLYTIPDLKGVSCLNVSNPISSLIPKLVLGFSKIWNKLFEINYSSTILSTIKSWIQNKRLRNSEFSVQQIWSEPAVFFDCNFAIFLYPELTGIFLRILSSVEIPKGRSQTTTHSEYIPPALPKASNVEFQSRNPNPQKKAKYQFNKESKKYENPHDHQYIKTQNSIPGHQKPSFDGFKNKSKTDQRASKRTHSTDNYKNTNTHYDDKSIELHKSNFGDIRNNSQSQQHERQKNQPKLPNNTDYNLSPDKLAPSSDSHTTKKRGFSDYGKGGDNFSQGKKKYSENNVYYQKGNQNKKNPNLSNSGYAQQTSHSNQAHYNRDSNLLESQNTLNNFNFEPETRFNGQSNDNGSRSKNRKIQNDIVGGKFNDQKFGYKYRGKNNKRSNK